MMDETFLSNFTGKEQELKGIGAKEKEEGRHNYMTAANRMIRGHI